MNLATAISPSTCKLSCVTSPRFSPSRASSCFHVVANSVDDCLVGMAQGFLGLCEVRRSWWAHIPSREDR